MYLRSCEIYANETAVADPQIGSIGDEIRSNKKLDPVEMYWRSRDIYENESIAIVTKDAPVVDTSVEDLLDDSTADDDRSMWDEAPEFSVETLTRDCVSVNWWDRDPDYEEPGVFTSRGVQIDSVWGTSRDKTGRMSLVKSLIAR